MWEDSQNEWKMEFQFNLRDETNDDVHRVWERLVFKVIGEDFINSEQVKIGFLEVNYYLDSWNKDLGSSAKE